MQKSGKSISIEMSKLPDKRHYHFKSFYLGSDDVGVWVAVPQGTNFSRPDHQFTSGFPQVLLVPNGQPWIAHYFGYSSAGKPPRHAIYTDITTVPSWESNCEVLKAVDLDLDVVQQNDGIIRIDDIDEFRLSKAANYYSKEVITLAAETCIEIYSQMREASGPFDGRYQDWLSLIGAKSPLS